MTIPEIIYELLIVVFDFAVMYMLLDISLKNVKKKNLILSLSILTLSLISSTFVAEEYGSATFTAYYPLLVQAPMYIMFYVVSKYRGKKFLFVFLSTFIFSSPVTWLPFIVGAFTYYSIKIMLVASIVTYFIMLVLVNKYIALLFHYALENLQNGWLLLSSLPILYAILSYLADENNHSVAMWKETSYFRVLLLAIIYSAYVLIFVLFKKIREQFLLKNEQAILTIQMDAMKEHLSELKISQTIAAIYRHDLRHHLQYVNTCILQSNIEEASKYIMSICGEIDDSIVVRYCENDSVNMIISSYVTKAKNAEINITVCAAIPTSIHVPTTDLCVVLANGIENAILACEKIFEKEKKKINLSCHIKSNKIFIQIINPYDGAIEFQEDIPISNREGHGMGTMSIVNIAKKYQGIYSFEAKDSIFTLSVII